MARGRAKERRRRPLHRMPRKLGLRVFGVRECPHVFRVGFSLVHMSWYMGNPTNPCTEPETLLLAESLLGPKGQLFSSSCFLHVPVFLQPLRGGELSTPAV